MHVLTLLWLAHSACRPLEAANCTANHMYSNKNTLKKESNLFIMCLPAEPFVSMFTCCWCCVKLCVWVCVSKRGTSSAKLWFHGRAPSAPERVGQGAAAGAAQKLTGRQTRQIGQVERGGNHKLARNAKSASANFSQAATPLFFFCAGQPFCKLPLHAELLSYPHNLAR